MRHQQGDERIGVNYPMPRCELPGSATDLGTGAQNPTSAPCLMAFGVAKSTPPAASRDWSVCRAPARSTPRATICATSPTPLRRESDHPRLAVKVIRPVEHVSVVPVTSSVERFHVTSKYPFA